MTFNDLQPGILYTVTLNSFTNGGKTDPVELTFETGPPSPIITFESIMSSIASLSWTTHERIQFYQVSFSPDLAVMIPEKYYGNTLDLENLPSLTDFNVTIVGVGGDFKTDEFHTNFKTAPASPEVFIKEVSTSKFTIYWSQVPQASTVEIEIFPTTEHFPNGLLKLSQIDGEYQLGFLEPLTRYYIKLSCIIDAKTHTNIVSLSQITAPEAPEVFAKNITSSRMDIGWTEVQDAAYYVLNVFPKLG
jgi:hypothetical protein